MTLEGFATLARGGRGGGRIVVDAAGFVGAAATTMAGCGAAGGGAARTVAGVGSVLAALLGTGCEASTVG